mmetsp:Transcript_22239/g.53869  ORF Transcript_22239/g.53869 Transcript_22239/m.53869 type:complete len:222 (+) Transcript_22239:1345-2010(+)
MLLWLFNMASSITASDLLRGFARSRIVLIIVRNDSLLILPIPPRSLPLLGSRGRCIDFLLLIVCREEQMIDAPASKILAPRPPLTLRKVITLVYKHKHRLAQLPRRVIRQILREIKQRISSIDDLKHHRGTFEDPPQLSPHVQILLVRCDRRSHVRSSPVFRKGTGSDLLLASCHAASPFQERFVLHDVQLLGGGHARRPLGTTGHAQLAEGEIALRHEGR